MASRKKKVESKKINAKEFFAAIEQIAAEKMIDPEFIYAQFRDALVKAAKRADAEERKQYEAKKRREFKRRKAERLQRFLAGEITEEEAYAEEDADQALLEAEAEKDPSENETVGCEIDPEKQVVRIFKKYKVVDVVEAYNEITVEQVEELRQSGDEKEYRPGDVFEIEIEEPEIFGRLFAMNVKGIIHQGISEEERARKAKDIGEKDKEVVTAKVQYVDSDTGDARILIGRDFFTIRRNDQLPNDRLQPDQDIKVYVSVEKVNGDDGRAYANISRRDPGMVKRLFEMEVPEISDGTIEIVAVSREAGSRTKISVRSENKNVDPIGACIGPRGQRVNTVIKELNGEKIDVIPYSDDPEKYIATALSPAKVVEVNILPTEEGQKKACEVVVPNDQLSLAIGNKGQNVRLAARLTGWKIDIKPEDDRFGLLSR